MRWWCSQLYEPWSWTPRPYIGVWVVVAILAIVRWRALRSRKAATGSIDLTTRQRVWFWLGLFFLWLASDWPVGALGAGYLASVHMTQYMLYTFAAAPLFILAAPEWWVRKALARTRSYRLVGWLARPVHAVIIANGVMIATHAPWTVDTLRGTQLGSFLLDVLWMVNGLVLWYPVISSLPEHRVQSPLGRSGYLFMAAGVAALIPAGFLTFSSSPLYSSYEIAPRIGLDALDDQQLAGAIMKVGAMPVIWITIAAIWIKWAAAERAADEAAMKAAKAAAAAEREADV